MKVYFKKYFKCDVVDIILYVVQVFFFCYGYDYSVDIFLSVDIFVKSMRYFLK